MWCCQGCMFTCTCSCISPCARVSPFKFVSLFVVYASLLNLPPVYWALISMFQHYQAWQPMDTHNFSVTLTCNGLFRYPFKLVCHVSREVIINNTTLQDRKQIAILVAFVIRNFMSS